MHSWTEAVGELLDASICAPGPIWVNHISLPNQKNSGFFPPPLKCAGHCSGSSEFGFSDLAQESLQRHREHCPTWSAFKVFMFWHYWEAATSGGHVGSEWHNLRSRGPIRYTKELLCDLKSAANHFISLGRREYTSSLFSIWLLNAVMENLGSTKIAFCGVLSLWPG